MLNMSDLKKAAEAIKTLEGLGVNLDNPQLETWKYEKVINFVKKNPKATTSEIAQHAGCTKNYIHQLSHKNKIKKNAKGGFTPA